MNLAFFSFQNIFWDNENWSTPEHDIKSGTNSESHIEKWT